MPGEEQERHDYDIEQFRDTVALQCDAFRPRLADGVEHEMEEVQQDDERCVYRVRFFLPGDQTIGFMTYIMEKNEDGGARFDCSFAQCDNGAVQIFAAEQATTQA